MDHEIVERIGRISAALAVVDNKRIEMVKPTISDDGLTVDYDFSCGQTDAQASNHLHSAIHQIASFLDHLKRWARNNNVDPKAIDKFLKQSPEICIILDLANNDKHGYPPRNKGHSGKSPQITRVDCGLRMGGQGGGVLTEDGSFIDMTGGTNSLSIEGVVVDGNGRSLGGTHELLAKALGRYEESLSRFGVHNAEGSL